ncbi:hypothetical protein [Actinoplanes palleronii]|uniref:Uncharacterized protein n=1 Tax=Actinoplanes palleronii TaxID=113570 RepID=A0ABQ4BJ67_9ACTN|nr:hypothetical protein [Actinoplanes palleronii]GIE70647.1 hypothetical protein Apa02nite_067550 [Actinoplanes palleronii]
MTFSARTSSGRWFRFGPAFLVTSRRPISSEPGRGHEARMALSRWSPLGGHRRLETGHTVVSMMEQHLTKVNRKVRIDRRPDVPFSLLPDLRDPA